MPRDDVSSRLPLKTAWFHILLTLADGPHHGYAIRAETEERTKGRVTLWPATLYGSIRDLEEAGMIAERPAPEGAVEDERRRYYALTSAGEALLRAETERLSALVDSARATRALRNA